MSYCKDFNRRASVRDGMPRGDNMWTTRRIRAKYGGNICRMCVNHEYRVHLERRDCRYGKTESCRLCGSYHHPVKGFTLSGHVKMLFTR